MFEYTATGRYYKTYLDGVYQTQHSAEREAIERCNQLVSDNPDSEVIYRHEYEVRVIGSVASQEGDTEAPTQPGSLTANVISATEINYTWAASTDNVGVTGYQVFVDGNPEATTTETNYPLQSLTPSTQYSVEVSAFDAAGNNSPNAGPSLATTDPNSAPVWALGNQSGETGGAVNIDLDTVCTDSDGDTINYSLLSGTLPTGLALSGSRNETLSGTLTEADVDNFTLQASDGITTTDVSVVFTVTAPDTVAPAVPIGLAVGTTTQSTVPLTINANVEGDLAYYSFYRSTDDVNFGKVTTDGAQTTTSFTDTGRSADTTYYYTVTATDDSGNESAQSASVQAITQAFGSDPYDLSGFSIPFSYSWPTSPNTTSTFNVPADGSFATAVGTSGRLVIVAAGYTGSGGSVASDIDILMDNTASITSDISLGSSQRIRIVGGNLTGGTLTGNGFADALVNNLNIDTSSDFATNLSVSQAPFQRCAIINSNLLCVGGGGTGWALFVRPVSGATNHNGLIIANVNSGTSGYQANRINATNNLIIVDSIGLNGGSTQSGWRMHNDCTNVFAENVIGRGRFLMNPSPSGPAVLNGTFINWHQYNLSVMSAAWALQSGSANTGSVSNSKVHFENGAGSMGGISPLTDGGGNTRVAWDGSTIDYSEMPGKSSLSDYGADH